MDNIESVEKMQPLNHLERGAWAHINQQVVDRSVNKALPWVAIACILAGLSIGISAMMPSVFRANIGQAKAELRQEFNKEIEGLNARVSLAEEDASLAKNSAQRMEAKINAELKLKSR